MSGPKPKQPTSVHLSIAGSYKMHNVKVRKITTHNVLSTPISMVGVKISVCVYVYVCVFVWVMFYFRCFSFFANTSCQRLLLRLCYRWPAWWAFALLVAWLFKFISLKLYVFVCIAEINILLYYFRVKQFAQFTHPNDGSLPLYTGRYVTVGRDRLILVRPVMSYYDERQIMSKRTPVITIHNKLPLRPTDETLLA